MDFRQNSTYRFYFQVALKKQPALIFFVILIVFGVYDGIKKLYLKKKKIDDEMYHKKLIFMFLLINFILLIWGYFTVWG